MRHPVCHPTTDMCHTHTFVLGETCAHMVIACLIHTLSTLSNNLLQCDTQSFVCVHFFFCLSFTFCLGCSLYEAFCLLHPLWLSCLFGGLPDKGGGNWGSEVDRKSGGLCCERKGRVQWGEGLRTEREEGVVLGLSVSGACGNAASLNCTVGLNLKYALLCCFSFLSTLFCLLLQGLNGFEYFRGWWVGECLPSGQNVEVFLCVCMWLECLFGCDATFLNSR